MLPTSEKLLQVLQKPGDGGIDDNSNLLINRYLLNWVQKSTLSRKSPFDLGNNCAIERKDFCDRGVNVQYRYGRTGTQESALKDRQKKCRS